MCTYVRARVQVCACIHCVCVRAVTMHMYIVIVILWNNKLLIIFMYLSSQYNFTVEIECLMFSELCPCVCMGSRVMCLAVLVCVCISL